MADEMKKSKVVHEKETLQGIAVLLIAGGASVVLACINADVINWMKLLAGGASILIGFGIFWLRGYLKLNRWGHVDIITDNTLMQRFITWMELRSQ
jgi:hypothetical protein